jgi:hypothetical protein
MLLRPPDATLSKKAAGAGPAEAPILAQREPAPMLASLVRRATESGH